MESRRKPSVLLDSQAFRGDAVDAQAIVFGDGPLTGCSVQSRVSAPAFHAAGTYAIGIELPGTDLVASDSEIHKRCDPTKASQGQFPFQDYLPGSNLGYHAAASTG